MNDALKYYLLEPRDPLIIRSARPFEEISDAEAARFPPPSTVAGALRNAHARSTGKELNEELRDIAVTGALPVKLDTDGKILTAAGIMVPRPVDAHYYFDRTNQKPLLFAARPEPLLDGEGCDLPHGQVLDPVQTAGTGLGKPLAGPQWWSLSDLLKWRESPDELTFDDISRHGWLPAPADIRTHIAVSNDSRSAEQGKIFQTTGLTMWQRLAQSEVFPSIPVGILAGIAGEINTGWLNLGGERRLASITPCQSALQAPETWPALLTQSRGVVLTLLTPALFKRGWLPDWIHPDTLTGSPPACPELKLRLRGAALGRWQPHSGWNLAKKIPRAARRMVPAGATYWFAWDNDVPSWESFNKLWFQHFCDDPQDNLDGFGLALPSPWLTAH